MNEIWKPVKGYEELYEISNLGNIKSLIGWSGKKYYKRIKILNPQKNSRGYLRINLKKYGDGNVQFIHRLVAQAFIPNLNNYPCVNHKDENILNNRVENLEWCTFKYNMNYGTLRERQAKKCSFPVNQYDLQGNFIKRWNSMKEVGRTLNISPSCIARCCKNEVKTSKKCIWRYADE